MTKIPKPDSADKIDKANKRYQESEKGKATVKRYFKSPKGKESQKRYTQSEKGKAALLRYRMSEKGKRRDKLNLSISKLVTQYSEHQKTHPESTFEDFLKINNIQVKQE